MGRSGGERPLMAYASVQDMIDRFTDVELKQLAPLSPAVAPFYDAARVGRALDDASAELDSYLAVRFSVPLVEAPPLLIKAACDLAREALDRQGRQMVLDAAKRARGWAKDVSAGRASLGAGPDGDAEALPEADGAVIAVDAPERVFTDDALSGFLR